MRSPDRIDADPRQGDASRSDPRGQSRLPRFGRRGILASIGGLTAPVPSGSAAAPRVTVTVASAARSANLLPLFAAERLGAFAREGLSVRFMAAGAVDRVTRAVERGEADFGFNPFETTLVGAATEGRAGRLRAVAGNLNGLPLSLVARPGIGSLADLRGKRLGTSALGEGTALYTREILRRRVGFEYPRDFAFEVVGAHPARWAALQQGRIDAALQLAPLNFVARDAGYANLADAWDVIPEYPFVVVLADRGRLAADRGRAEKFLRALAAGTTWSFDPANRAAAEAIVVEEGDIPAPLAGRTMDLLMRPGMLARDLGVDRAGLPVALDLLERFGQLPTGRRERALRAVDDRIGRRLGAGP